MVAAKIFGMTSTIPAFEQSKFRTVTPNFWESFLGDESLKSCSDLAKLVAGCELIAALDGVELLLAA